MIILEILNKMQLINPKNEQSFEFRLIHFTELSVLIHLYICFAKALSCFHDLLRLSFHFLFLSELKYPKIKIPSIPIFLRKFLINFFLTFLIMFNEYVLVWVVSLGSQFLKGWDTWSYYPQIFVTWLTSESSQTNLRSGNIFY